MLRLLRQFYYILFGKPTPTSTFDFDTLFAMLEAEQHTYRLEHGLMEDEPETTVAIRRHELERYFERYKPSLDDVMTAIQPGKPNEPHTQLS